MHDHTKLTQDRIGHLKERLEREITEEICPLQVTAWQVPSEPVSFKEATAANYQPFPPGTWWGAPWSTWWLHVTGTLPASHAGEEVDLSMDLGFVGDWAGSQSEAIVYTANGRPSRPSTHATTGSGSTTGRSPPDSPRRASRSLGPTETSSCG